MEHAAKVIFGQDLLMYFRRKVPDFLIFEAFMVQNRVNLGKIHKICPILDHKCPKLKKSKIGDFTSEIHIKIPNLAKNRLIMFH